MAVGRLARTQGVGGIYSLRQALAIKMRLLADYSSAANLSDTSMVEDVALRTFARGGIELFSTQFGIVARCVVLKPRQAA